MKTLNLFKSNELPIAVKIGTGELKSSMKANTLKGFAVTNTVFLLIAASFILLSMFEKPIFHQIPWKPISTGIEISEIPFTLDDPEVKNTEQAPPAPIDATNFKTEEIIANFVPTFDTDENAATNVATTENISNSLSSKDGIEIGKNNIDNVVNFERNISAPVINRQPVVNDIPDEEEFQYLEKEPSVNINELHSHIVYPEIAIKAGLNGKVLLSVLISEDGSVMKTNIVTSTSNIFNNAAIDAVMKTRFQAAEEGGRKVKAWIRIPIQFKLK